MDAVFDCNGTILLHCSGNKIMEGFGSHIEKPKFSLISNKKTL